MHVCYADRLFVSVYRQNVTSMQRHTDSQTERERERETAESFQRDPALSCNSSDNDVHLCRTARPTCSRLIDIIRITTMFEIEILRQDKTYS